MVKLKADGSFPDAYLVIYPKGRQLETLHNLNENVEPMIYPLFFPLGRKLFFI